MRVQSEISDALEKIQREERDAHFNFVLNFMSSFLKEQASSTFLTINEYYEYFTPGFLKRLNRTLYNMSVYSIKWILNHPYWSLYVVNLSKVLKLFVCLMVSGVPSRQLYKLGLKFFDITIGESLSYSQEMILKLWRIMTECFIKPLTLSPVVLGFQISKCILETSGTALTSTISFISSVFQHIIYKITEYVGIDDLANNVRSFLANRTIYTEIYNLAQLGENINSLAYMKAFDVVIDALPPKLLYAVLRAFDVKVDKETIDTCLTNTTRLLQIKEYVKIVNSIKDVFYEWLVMAVCAVRKYYFRQDVNCCGFDDLTLVLLEEGGKYKPKRKWFEFWKAQTMGKIYWDEPGIVFRQQPLKDGL